MQGLELASVISYVVYGGGKRALIQTNMIDRRNHDFPIGTTSFEKIVHDLKSGVTLKSKKREKWIRLTLSRRKISRSRLAQSVTLDALRTM